MPSIKYKNYVLFLEENDGQNFVSIYKNASQIDYTKIHRNPDEAFEEAKKIVDKIVDK